LPGFGQPDAQIFIWCTVATRAWTESERAHWSQLPLRCRRNALLVATHKDALAHTADIDKVEQRLHGAAADMFRDVVLVTATGSPRPGVLPYLEAPPLDQGADFLLDRIAAWTAEISARRARKAEKIIRHLARLTFHRLMPGPFDTNASAILKEWERDCAKLLAGIDGSPASAVRTVQGLLARFAHSVNESRAGSVAPGAPMPLPQRSPQVSASSRAAAMRRYVRLIGADLTALLRIDLAQWGMREPARYLDYATARSILLPLANLDATFEELGQRFAAPNSAATETAPADMGLTGSRRH